ncbi:DUF2797 domain-containing protein [Psychromicrobium sp. YIM B11713]|uniref:DUF2797 domain-containing protein n=1 Tax=Psychromicrobium sp. YIM B11713 TaxID=3145233 RepID=UPI00374F5DAE
MLVRGVDWSSGRPFLRGAEGESSLEPGTTLRFRVLDGRRHCLGFSRIEISVKNSSGPAAPAPGPTSAQQIPCPQGALAERGYQCGSCFSRDDFRFMHDFHRSGTAPEGLRIYLSQPHWLYIASFANGASKVGTASQLRKAIRLSEQGAVAAQYVAHADDGRIVRILEDSVSEGLGLAQLVRSANKLGSLTEAWSFDAVSRANRELADQVREYLSAITIDGFRVVQQDWQLPAPSAAFLPGPSDSAPQSYPLPLDSGEHGLPITAVLGSFALLELEGQRFVAHLGELKGKLIELGDFSSELPALQNSLF